MSSCATLRRNVLPQLNARPFSGDMNTSGMPPVVGKNFFDVKEEDARA